MTTLLMIDAAIAGYIVCDVMNARQQKRQYEKGRHLGYLMGRNDAFYGDDRLAEVTSE